jgi:ferredoxin-thioredoxin reductase catalytic subunit
LSSKTADAIEEDIKEMRGKHKEMHKKSCFIMIPDSSFLIDLLRGKQESLNTLYYSSSFYSCWRIGVL